MYKGVWIKRKNGKDKCGLIHILKIRKNPQVLIHKKTTGCPQVIVD